MAQRLVRKLTEVIDEVLRQIQAHYNVTPRQIEAWRRRAQSSAWKFPDGTMIAIEDIWIDYEVQRDVLYKHIINICSRWDARICSPGSACRVGDDGRVMLYDAQHRFIAAGILGYTHVPCAVVHTDDKNFPSYAFEMLNDTGVKRLTPGDLHRNALVRYRNGSRELRNVLARTMQDQFDAAGIDLQDKSARASDTLRGSNDYFFSHFKYAQKVMDLDQTGQTLLRILLAIRDTFPLQEEIDQGVFIGLYELERLGRTQPNVKQPDDWMKSLLASIKSTFKSSSLVHSKAKTQWQHRYPGATWSAPSAMSNFMRELHVRANGSLNLPYHGEGSRMGIDTGDLAPGLIVQAEVA